MRTLSILTIIASLTIGASTASAKEQTDPMDKALIELADSLGNRLASGGLIAIDEISPLEGCPSSEHIMNSLVTALKNRGIRARTKASTEAALNEAARAMQVGTASEDAPLEGAVTAFNPILEGRGSQCAVIISAHDIASAQFLGRATALFTATKTHNAKVLSLDLALRRLSDQLVKHLDNLGGDKRYQRFAVLEFNEVGETTSQKELGKLVSSELQTWLRRDHSLLLVERQQLNSLIEEIQLGQTGLIDEEEAVAVGQMSGAEALIMGSVLEAGDHYVVNAKIVSAASGQVVAAERTELPAADLIALSSDAVVLRSRSGAVFRSMLIPGWGQFYNREPLKGSLFLTAELATGGLAAAFHILHDKNRSAYNKLGADAPLSSFENKRQAMQRQQEMRRNLLTAALVIHALNALDAFFTAESYESSNPGVNGNGFSLTYKW